MKFFKLVKKLFGAKSDFVFKSDLAQSDFQSVEEALGLMVPQALASLYLLGKPNEVNGDALYRFVKKAGDEVVEYMFKFLPVSRENQTASADIPLIANGQFVVFAIDDFANIYFMEASKSSTAVLFCDLDLSRDLPILVADSLADLVSNLEPITDKT